MTAYTKIPKPTAGAYVNVNLAKPAYDEPSLLYDDPNVFYDGIDQNMYTKIAKPIGVSLTWDGMTMQWQNANQNWDAAGSGYTNVPKPT